MKYYFTAPDYMVDNLIIHGLDCATGYIEGYSSEELALKMRGSIDTHLFVVEVPKEDLKEAAEVILLSRELKVRGFSKIA